MFTLMCMISKKPPTTGFSTCLPGNWSVYLLGPQLWLTLRLVVRHSFPNRRRVSGFSS